MNSILNNLGWYSALLDDNQSTINDSKYGRISAVFRNVFIVITEEGEFKGHLQGKVHFDYNSLPVVGDWVIVKKSDNETVWIQSILQRRNNISRKTSNKQSFEQVIASNLDYVFIVQSLDQNFNLRRLERYITMVIQSQIEPIVLLNKSDLCQDYFSFISKVNRIAPNIQTVAVSTQSGLGMDKVASFFKPGITACFVGSSGVGKSTIINKLLRAEIQKTNSVRMGDSKGRHTTTTRQLFMLPEGGLVIDTPGMRELSLWLKSSQLEESFNDIRKLSISCLFKNCGHNSEPECAVKKAVEEGVLDINRYKNFQKLKTEADFQEKNKRLSIALKRTKAKKKISLTTKKMYKKKKKSN